MGKIYLIVKLSVCILITLLTNVLYSQLHTVAYNNVANFNQSDPLSIYYGMDDPGVRGIWVTDDLDNDGKVEILATDYSNGGRINVFEYNGNGQLELVWSSPVLFDVNTNSTPRWVQSGDLDGDGNKEIIWPSGLRYEGEIQVWENVGDNDYGTATILDFPANIHEPQGIGTYRMDRERGTVYDFDGDGQSELIMANYDATASDGYFQKVYILSINGNAPGFASWQIEGGDPNVHPTNGLTGGSWWHSVPADIDGDDKIEIVNHYWNFYSFWSIDVNGPDDYTYPSAPNPDGDVFGPVYYEFMKTRNEDVVSYMGVEVVDVEGDGKDEIAGITGYSGPNRFGIALVSIGQGEDGVEVWDDSSKFSIISTRTDHGLSDESNFWCLGHSDLDKNGIKEILLGGGYGENLISIEFDGIGDLLEPESYHSEILFEGDEKEVGNWKYITILDSIGVIRKEYSIEVWDNPIVIKVIGGHDITNDGYEDIVLAYQSVSDTTEYIYKRWNGSQYITDSIVYKFNPNQVNIRVLSSNGPYLQLKRPQEEDVLKPGAQYYITWNTNYVNEVKIEYSYDNGLNWNIIVDSVDASLGKFLWTIPNTPSLYCLVKISSVDDFIICDISDKNFTIYYEVEEGLIAYYPFNANTDDESGNNYNGIGYGISYDFDRYGNENNAAYFDGNTWIKLPDDIRFQPLQSVSISYWLKTSQSSRFDIFNQRIGDSSPNNYNFGTIYNYPINNQKRLEFNYPGYHPNRESEDTYPVYENVDNNEWQHHVFVKETNQGKYSIYINGELHSEEILGDVDFDVNGHLIIGKSYNDYGFYNGLIDDIRIYNRTLTQGEISTLYAGFLDYIHISLDTITANPNDTVYFPLNVSFPSGFYCSSFELKLNGFQQKLKYLGIGHDSTTFLDNSWEIIENNTDSELILVAAGSEDIFGAGNLFNLVFEVPDTTEEQFIPILINSAIFNNDENPVVIKTGGINVEKILYGDVNLDGQVRAFDASQILKYLVGYIELSSKQIKAGNVSSDSTLSALDATLILEFVAELIDSLPYNTSVPEFRASGDVYTTKYIDVGNNGNFELPVYFNNGENIYSMYGELSYDNTALSVDTIMFGLNMELFQKEINYEENKIRIAAANTHQDGKSGLVFKVKFNVLEPVLDDSINVSISKWRWNENDILSDIVESVIIVDVSDNQNLLPSQYSLDQNYPNPFNPYCTIKYSIPKQSFVQLRIFDAIGREIKTFINKEQSPGNYEIEFIGSQLSSGIYFYQLRAGDYVKTMKMIILK
ncbi:LamG-like jellyroll fold domain-containing protein [Bacteroidota bacterium]